MSGKINLVIIGVVVGMIGVYAYYNQITTEDIREKIPEVIEKIEAFTPKPFINKAGDYMELLIPNEPEVEDNQITPVQPQEENQTQTNQTEVAPTGTLDAQTAGISYSRQKIKSEVVDQRIQIGNQVKIQGTMALVTSSGGGVDPPYKYTLEITCSEFLDPCNLEPIARHDQTDTLGNFEYTWTPAYISQEGIYLIKITARSFVLDQQNRPYTLEGKMFVELYQ